MTIKKTGQFYSDEGNTKLGILPSIGIDSSNLEKCLHEIELNNIEGVFGHPNFGFQEDNLDFLDRIPHVRQLHFWDVDIKNVDGIYHLKHLESISIEPRRPGIDFSKFPELKKIITDYHSRDSGFTDLNEVKLFHLWNFKSKEKNFRILKLPPNIEELEITKSNSVSLEGLPRLERLKYLGIHYCRNLESIDHLIEIAPNLEKLVVEKCSKLNCYDIVKRLVNIGFANVNGITIVENGNWLG